MTARGPRRDPPPPLGSREDGEAYQRLLGTAGHLGTGDQYPYEWAFACRDARPEIVAAALVSLAGTGTAGAQLEALRDAARVVVDAKLSASLIDAMEKLEGKATFVGVVGILVAVVGVFVAIAQLVSK